MKCIRWVEAYVPLIPKGKISRQSKEDCTGDIVEKKTLPHSQSSPLPIASAFSSRNFSEPCAQPIVKEEEIFPSGPLISRPRPIAHDGTEKSFFSRGTIPTENINLPTRIHLKYRPSYTETKGEAVEKPLANKFPGRQDLFDVIAELYPNMKKFVGSTTSFQRKSSPGFNDTCSTSTISNSKCRSAPMPSAVGSHDLTSDFPDTIPEYANLPTPPLSPLVSTRQNSVSHKNQIRTSCTDEEVEFHKLRNFLISYINIKGNKIPRKLKLRILEHYSISSAYLVPERATVCDEEDDMEDLEISVKKLAMALKNQIPDTYHEMLEADEVNEHPEKTYTHLCSRTAGNLAEVTEKFTVVPDSVNEKIVIEYSSDPNLARCQRKYSISHHSELDKTTNSTLSTKKLPKFKLKRTFDKTIQNNRNVIRRAVSGVLG